MMTGYDTPASSGYAFGDGGGDAAAASNIISAINQSVAITASIVQYGIEHEEDPVARHNYIVDNWQHAMFGLDKMVRQVADLQQERELAARNIANPDSWWNKEAGHAKDPLWMAGQKKIVEDYPANLRSLLSERAPGLDNMTTLVDTYWEDDKGNLEAYRKLSQNWLASTLAISALAPMWAGQFAALGPLPGMLKRKTLEKIWPGDPDTRQGRVPAAFRGDLLSQTLAAANAGVIPLDTPVPWWLLGFNETEFRDVLNGNPLSLPTYRTLTILNQARDARLARQMGL